jgi:hypothetical protein
MEANRPESARRLWERLPPNDPSVWIRYSAALIEFVSWKILEEDGSTCYTAELLLARAIKANIFCAYYLAFFDVFSQVMEYTEDIEDADESSPLEEAIEYCNSEQLGAWKGTDGALDWMKNVLLRSLKGDSVGGDEKLTVSDLDWRSRLVTNTESHLTVDRETSHETRKEDSGDESNNDSNENSDDDESVVDMAMYSTMFETAMEMVEASGEFKKN